MTEQIRKGTIDPTDFLDLDDTLGGEDRLVRDTVRSFVADKVLPNIASWYEDGALPTELSNEMGDLGLLGMHLDGYGCAGTSGTAYGLACTELEAGDSGVRSFVSVQGSLAMYPIWAFGSDDHKDEWLPQMASGDSIGCFGLTEPDSGSDPSSMRTFARRDGTDWILNGTKMWITNGSIADVAIIWAGTEDGIRGFVVPTESAGFSSNPIGHKLSLRASITSELVFDDIRLPADAVLPGVSGMGGPLACLNQARFGITFGAVGAARACYVAALDYARERHQFGRSLASFQLTQQKLVDMMVGINQGMLLALDLGKKFDSGNLAAEHINFGKLANVRMAREVARDARSILGANGITLDYPVMRHMTNLESVYTYEGTNEIHTLVLGQAITGISAFS
jgi:glutaryl-CoA dehydrogenase